VLEHSEVPVRHAQGFVQPGDALLAGDVLQLDAAPQVAERHVERGRQPGVQVGVLDGGLPGQVIAVGVPTVGGVLGRRGT